MFEIISIILSLFFFSIFMYAPLNIHKSNIINIKSSYQQALLNLIINLNFLLIISLLPIKLNDYFLILFIILFLISIFNFVNSFKKFKINKLFFSIYFILFFILSVDIAVKLNLGWDAKWFWYIKSLYFYQNLSFYDLSQYEFNSFHPHFGSYLWAFFRKLSLSQLEYNGRIFYVFVYLSSLFFLLNSSNKNKIQKCVLILLLTLITYKYNLFSGLQEILIFSFLVIISKLIFQYINDKKDTYLVFILLCMNLILWIKAEGIAYFAIIFLLLNLIKNFEFKKKFFFISSSVILILFKVLIYKYFKISLNEQPYFVDYIFNLDFQLIIFKLQNIFAYMGYYSLLNIIFFIVPIIFIINHRKIFKDEYQKIMFIAFLLNIGFIISAYLFRDMEIVYSIRTTMARIIFTSSGLFIFYLINFLKLKNYFNK